MKICDIHTHVMPGVDDGAQTIEQALQMLSNAAASCVEYLVLTPHCNRPGQQIRTDLPDIYQQLCRHSEHIPVNLALGAEVHVTKQLPALLEKQVFPTINASRYLLTEFPFNWPRDSFLPMLKKIRTLGYIPVVAHPERCFALWKEPALVGHWLEAGCHVQLTAGSIVGKYGKDAQKCAAFLLRNGMACCVASDAHGVNHRNNNLLEVQSYLSLYYSRQCANALLWDNPMMILRNETF